MRTVIGLYHRLEDLQCALQALQQEGFPEQAISLIAGDPDGAIARDLHGIERADREHDENPLPAGFAESLGGLSPLQTTDAGTVLAGGPLAATLFGANPSAGELTGALIGAGVPEEDGMVFCSAIAGGGGMLVVYADARFAERAAMVMNRCHPVDIDREQARGGMPGMPVTGGMEDHPAILPGARQQNHIRSYIRQIKPPDWGNP